MTFRDIVAVTGLPGLYVLTGNKSDGAIVRDIAGGASRFLPARLHRVTPLNTIEVYTTGPNVRLQEVLAAMQSAEGTHALPDGKADKTALRAYFDAVYPDYDAERVYESDLKKIVRWYGILRDADLLKFEAAADSSEATSGDSTSEDALASTTDMPIEGAVQLEEETKGDETTGPGLVEDATAGKKPRAKKSAEAVQAAEESEGGAAPAKKARASKKAAEPTEEGEAAPKKSAPRKKKDE